MVRLMLIGREEQNRASWKMLGIKPSNLDLAPLPAMRQLISGISKNSARAVLPSCTCTLFLVDLDDLGRKRYTQADSTVSDATTGVYSFSVGSAKQYRVTFDLAGAPVRAGITLDTLTGDSFGS